MREHLYRGKRVDNGEWVEGSLIKYELTWRDETSIHYDIAWNETDGSFRRVEVHPETVGQYTGLLDKNGVRIFEGDVVKWCEEAWKIEWHNEFACFVFVCSKDEWCRIDLQKKHSEVIGNVFDKGGRQ